MNRSIPYALHGHFPKAINLIFLVLWISGSLAMWHEWQHESQHVHKLLMRDAQEELNLRVVDVEGILLRTFHTIRTMSLLPGVRAGVRNNRQTVTQDAVQQGLMSAADYDTVQQLYNHIASSVAVSEIYIIYDGFDPGKGQVPAVMYDSVIVDRFQKALIAKGSSTDADVPEENESEEYADYVRQLAYFRQHHPRMPEEYLKAIQPINSHILRTCDNSQYTSIAQGDVRNAEGFTISVPIYDQKTLLFKGLVTAVLRRNVLEAALIGWPLVPVSTAEHTQLRESLGNKLTTTPVNLLLEQISTGTRIFDRRNTHWSLAPSKRMPTANEFQRTLNWPGPTPWVMYNYVSQEQLNAELERVRNPLEAAFVVMSMALFLFWMIVISFLTKQRKMIATLEQLGAEKVRMAQELEGQRDKLETQVVTRTAELTLATQIAQSASRAKSEFLSSMSHELRTPLTAILGFAQMLECSEKLDAEDQDNTQEILKAGRHLLNLINEVLDLAKIEAGRVELSIESVGLDDLIKNCDQLIRPMASRKRLSLHFDVLPDAAVQADRMRLKQVLLNLLSNAVKYNREAGFIHLTVTPATNERLCICVTDGGIGIPPERRAALFEPFSRIDTDHSGVEGTGIGLTITRRLVNLMHGEVGVDHPDTGGSAFWIKLPAATAMTKPGAADVDEPVSLSTPMDAARTYEVLYIDDNLVNLKLVTQLLSARKNIHLRTALHPKDGIKLAQSHKPDLVLLDISMPEMDGYAVLKVFKADARLSSVSVIAITANAMPRDIERGMQAGFVDYLTKPFEFKKFLNTIDRHLLTCSPAHLLTCSPLERNISCDC